MSDRMVSAYVRRSMQWSQRHPVVMVTAAAAAAAVAYLFYGPDEEEEGDRGGLDRSVSWVDEHGGNLTHGAGVGGCSGGARGRREWPADLVCAPRAVIAQSCTPGTTAGVPMMRTTR